MRLKLACLLAFGAALTIVTINVSALWYSGMNYPNTYGVWAYITTPLSIIHIYDDPPGAQSGISNWVSLPQPNWIQAGWNYYFDPGGNLHGPNQYVETCIYGCFGPPPRFYQEYDPQDWGSEVWYLIEFTLGTGNQWCAYIDGYQVACQPIIPPPISGKVFSEIQISSRNELDTCFNSVYYKGSDYVWRAFD